MDDTFKKLKYLKHNPRYRVKKESLERVIEMTVNSGLSSRMGPKEILIGEALNALLEDNGTLINIALPIMHSVFDDLTDKTRLILLCDSKGYIISMVSSQETIHRCYPKRVRLGACLDYYSCGTNSVSMAMYEGCPIAIKGDEHYCDLLKNWSCIAAPIRVNGMIMGYINISDQAISDLFEIIPLVNLIAKLIEERMKKYRGHEIPNPDDYVSNPDDYVSKNVLESPVFFGKMISIAKERYQWNLTMRELEVMFKLYSGKSLNDISHDLSISINTVKTHIRNIWNKVGVESNTDLIDKVKSALVNKSV